MIRGPPGYILGALTTELYGPEYRVLVSDSYQLCDRLLIQQNVLLGTKFSCLVGCDELGVKLSPEDTLRQSEIVGVDSIRHEGSMSSGRRCSEGSDRILAHRSQPYMHIGGGP